MISGSARDRHQDTRLLDAIAKRLDVEFAIARYDSLFGR
jgi:hypothetical protein